jgi:hypothetical protein
MNSAKTQGTQMKTPNRSEWTQAISKVANGASWFSRTGIGSAAHTENAMLGDECLGHWDNQRNEGWVY